jgi:hypothetical protein
MEIQVKVNPTTIVTLEAAKQKDLFKLVASAYEVFGEKKCGLCGGTDIIPKWRVVTVLKGKKTETYEFPEYRCQGRLKDGTFCGARLNLSTINDDTGTIFPQRKLLANGKPPGKDDGDQAKYGSHNGWTRYKGEKADNGGDE